MVFCYSSNTKVCEVMYVLRYPCDFSSWWNAFCVCGFIICLSCVIVKYSDVCAKQTMEGAAGSHLLRENLSKVLLGMWSPENLRGVRGSSLALQSIPVALGCFSWLSSCGTCLREQQMLDTWNLQWGWTNSGIWHSRFFWPWSSPSPVPDLTAVLVPDLSDDLWLLHYFQ